MKVALFWMFFKGYVSFQKVTAIRQADPNEALRLKVAELLLRASESHLETALAAIMKDAG